jgi:hypothetical protein
MSGDLEERSRAVVAHLETWVGDTADQAVRDFLGGILGEDSRDPATHLELRAIVAERVDELPGRPSRGLSQRADRVDVKLLAGWRC